MHGRLQHGCLQTDRAPPKRGSFRACLAAAWVPGRRPHTGAAGEGRVAGSGRPRPTRRPRARTGAERVLRWWSLGEASAHVDGAQMMGKPGVAFRKARRPPPAPTPAESGAAGPALSPASGTQHSPSHGAAPRRQRLCLPGAMLPAPHGAPH